MFDMSQLRTIYEILVVVMNILYFLLGGGGDKPLPPPPQINIIPFLRPAVPPTKPPTMPPVAPSPTDRPDPENATVRIRFGGNGCSGTIIGPRRSDGAWDLLTAGHCIRDVRVRGEAVFKDGKRIGIVCTVKDAKTDLAWCKTAPADRLPYALLHAAPAEVGWEIWHVGYGIHTPGRREVGKVRSPANRDGMIGVTLLLSSGDSGSGIFRVSDGELVAVASSTDNVEGGKYSWGGSAVRAAAIRPPVVTQP